MAERNGRTARPLGVVMGYRKLCGALGAAALVTSGVLMSAGSIFADPPPLPNPPFHRHYIVQPDGTRIEVGPDLCENPEMQNAFNQFHYNVHHSFSGPTTPVLTLGPQEGAPGLHSINSPAGLVLRPCSFSG